jgi:hypothetical protein
MLRRRLSPGRKVNSSYPRPEPPGRESLGERTDEATLVFGGVRDEDIELDVFAALGGVHVWKCTSGMRGKFTTSFLCRNTRP